MSGASEDSPEARLWQHVAAVLDAASVPSSSRSDVGEELYGHLWQRWQDAIAAGEDPDAAVASAIRTFGDAHLVAREMTAAFHSRLYATTIGVLLPVVSPASERPAGFTRTRVLLGLTALFQLLGVFIYVYSETPAWAVVGAAGTLFGCAISLLAYGALARRQRWALSFATVVALVLIVDFGLELVLKPITIQFLGLLAIAVLPKVRAPAFGAWVAGSRPLNAALAALVVGTVAIQWGLGPALAAIPDPTLATASDVRIVAHASCSRQDDTATAGTLTVTVRWSRTDLFPGGLPWQTVPTDALDLAIGGMWGGEGQPADADFGQSYGIVTERPTFVDAATGANAGSDIGRATSTPPFFGASRSGWFDLYPIEPGTIRPNRDYVATYTFNAPLHSPPVDGTDENAASPGAGGPEYLPAFRIRYDHQGRFGLQAILACGQTEVAVPVSRADVADPSLQFQTFP